MKKLNILRAIPILIPFFLVTLSCSNSEEPTPGCYQEDNRQIFETVTNFSATILGPESQDCPSGFVIQPDKRLPNTILGILAPCNLSEDFRTDGLKVEVSGFIYESFEIEDICADFFEITEISLLP